METAYQGAELFEGECLGGPMDGQTGQSRFEEGFLLVAKADRKCWIYDWQEGEFVCRRGGALELDDAKRFKAAEESRYDVVSFPRGVV